MNTNFESRLNSLGVFRVHELLGGDEVPRTHDILYKVIKLPRVGSCAQESGSYQAAVLPFTRKQSAFCTFSAVTVRWRGPVEQQKKS